MFGGEEVQGVGHGSYPGSQRSRETASVYGRGDEKIGTIERLMLEKKSGTVAYAVVECGGLFKGEVRHYPLPWESLKYDVARKAYTTNLTLEELGAAHRSSTARLSTGATAPRFIGIRSIGRCRAANLPRAPVRSWSWCTAHRTSLHDVISARPEVFSFPDAFACAGSV